MLGTFGIAVLFVLKRVHQACRVKAMACLGNFTVEDPFFLPPLIQLPS